MGALFLLTFRSTPGEAEELADLLADNRIAEMAEMDAAMLRDIFSGVDVGQLDTSITGYMDAELFGAIESLADAAEDDEPDVEEDNFNYQEQYGVIVMCADEAEQKEVYDRLNGMGYACKVVAT